MVVVIEDYQQVNVAVRPGLPTRVRTEQDDSARPEIVDEARDQSGGEIRWASDAQFGSEMGRSDDERIRMFAQSQKIGLIAGDQAIDGAGLAERQEEVIVGIGRALDGWQMRRHVGEYGDAVQKTPRF